eukprot:COSAG06_NODE_1063_length_10870_cov_236.460217_1_plen_99_part_10
MDEEAALKALDQMATAMGSVDPTVIHWITAAAFATQAAWVRERSPVPRSSHAYSRPAIPRPEQRATPTAAMKLMGNIELLDSSSLPLLLIYHVMMIKRG